MSPREQHAVEPVQAVAPPLRRPRLMRQDWCDVTFVHWAVEPERVAAFMPQGVRPDTFGAVTYVGLVPFRMVGAGPARGPAVPWAGTFLETNVRLYSVDDAGRRGIVFLSLDTDRLVVVGGARAAFGLPYRWGQLRHRSRRFGEVDEHTYEARLRHPGARGASSRVVVRAGQPAVATALEEFLTSRWRLHVSHLGRTWYVPNTHPTWALRRAELVDLDDGGLLASVGLGELANRDPDHVSFSPGVPAEFGLPRLAR